jgi:hypothetical protein
VQVSLEHRCDQWAKGLKGDLFRVKNTSGGKMELNAAQPAKP